MEVAEEKTIGSLQEFIVWAKEFKAAVPNYEYFFRGHSKLSYKLIPNVYRVESSGRSSRKYERDMYFEMLNRVPQEFSPKDVFGNLVKMQHFGVPTRLLDVTKNALVALYFAVDGSSPEDGRVYGFGMHFDRVAFPQDLSPIYNWFPDYKRERGLLDLWGIDWWDDFMNKLVHVILQFLSLSSDPKVDSNCNIMLALEWFTQNQSRWDQEKLEKFTKEVVEEYWNIDIALFEKLSGEIARFLEGHCGVPKSLGGINFPRVWEMLINPIFVHSLMNNQRVISQQGGFILFPPNPFSLRESFFSSKKMMQSLSVIVRGDSKVEIKRELESLGVSEPALFPEIDKVAKFIKRKYSV